MKEKSPKEKSEKQPEIDQSAIAKLQLTEQALQNLLLQKQVFQFELADVISALDEIKKTKQNELFKIVGQLMIKSSKEDLEKELTRKKEILELRIKSIDKQEEEMKNKLLKERDELLKGLR